MPMLLVLLFAAGLAFADGLTFTTGPADLTKAGGYAFPMDEAAYRKFAEQTAKGGRVVAVTSKPGGLSGHELYGYNFVVSGKNRGWILDGDDEHGWVLYLDWRGDGDLSAAKPNRFEKGEDGAPRLQVEVNEGDVRWPCRFEVSRIDVEGQKKLGVKIATGSVRRGTIEIGGNQARFALTGSQGKYNGEYDSISVDRGSGPESYKVRDGRLNLFGKSYEFKVDPLGASLTLTELTEALPDRPSLKVGTAGPQFRGVDLDGGPVELAAYRGRVVLIEFWSTSCGPCRAEAPRMAKLYGDPPHDRVEFLGVSSDESEKTLRDFLSEFGLKWKQIREPFAGPIHKLYRVDGEPTYFIIGKAGEILDTWVGGGMTADRLGKALGK